MVHPIQDGRIRLDRREGEETGSPGKTTKTVAAIADGDRARRSSRIGRSWASFSTGPVRIEPGRNGDLTWHEDGVRGELGRVCGFERRMALHCKVRRGLERDSKREKKRIGRLDGFADMTRSSATCIRHQLSGDTAELKATAALRVRWRHELGL